jgi:hypothetical protein
LLTINAADAVRLDGGHLCVPRIMISAGIEMNEVLQNGRTIHIEAIRTDDPRVLTNEWYIPS